MRKIAVNSLLVLSVLLCLLAGSSANARFLQVDPIGYKDDLDLYTYVGNDPTDLIDPTGNQTTPTSCPDGSCPTNSQSDDELTRATNTAASMAKNAVMAPVRSLQNMSANGKADAASAAVVAGAVALPGEGGAVAGEAEVVAGQITTEAAGKLIPDSATVVRGGTSEIPSPGTTFSGAAGESLNDAAQGVPHGTIRATTAGDIRANGGTVQHAPEPTRSGVMNDKHVNITTGINHTFGEPQPNPVPKPDRVQ